MERHRKLVKPYREEAGGKKEQVQRMFDTIAPKYDMLNRLLSLGIDRGWRRKAVACLGQSAPGARILDIATGTGDLAFEIAKYCPDAAVTGLDLADGMLRIARTKSKKLGFEQRVTFIQGDSENLRFENNSYDAASVAFGVRNFDHLRKGLEEIYRILKPGGRLVVLEFTKPRVFPFKQLFGVYFKHVLPRIGGATSGDSSAYTYLYESVQAFPDYEAFTAELAQTGFTNASYQALTLGICAVYTAEK